MRVHGRQVSIGILVGLCTMVVLAQTNAVLTTPIIKVDPCRSEVSRFEETIGFLRRTQGNETAAAIKEKLLPAKLENEILFKSGYCGLAKYIKEKKLNR